MGTASHHGVTGELGPSSARRYPFEDPGLAIDPPVISTSPDDVEEVQALEDYRLHVRFFDGTTGTVEMREAVLCREAGMLLSSLADPEVFAQVGLGFGTVMWANGMDLAPDVMYDEIKRNGTWVLR